MGVDPKCRIRGIFSTFSPHGIFCAGAAKPTIVLNKVVPKVAEGTVALHTTDLVALEHVVLHGVLPPHGGGRLVRTLVVGRMACIAPLGAPVEADGLGVANGIVADRPTVTSAGAKGTRLRVVVVLWEPKVGDPLCKAKEPHDIHGDSNAIILATMTQDGTLNASRTTQEGVQRLRFAAFSMIKPCTTMYCKPRLCGANTRERTVTSTDAGILPLYCLGHRACSVMAVALTEKHAGGFQRLVPHLWSSGRSISGSGAPST